jgi:TPR repeat protein
MVVTLRPFNLSRRAIFCAAVMFSVFANSLVAAPGDSAPKLLSTSGGKGGGWANLAELKKAAEAHNPKACALYGDALLRGEDGAKQDVAQAILFLREAAEAGEANASFRLGKIYDDGEYTTKDYAKALEYYTTAAKAGVSEAQYNLGVMFASGHGVKRDTVEGLAWLIVATKNGAPADGENQIRERLTKSNRQKQIVSAEQRAAEILAGNLEPAPAAQATSPTHFTPAPTPGRIEIAGTGTSKISLALPATPPPNISKDIEARLQKNVDDSPPVNLMTPRQTVQHWDSLKILQDDAAKGTPNALWALGKVYLDGDLVAADTARAIQLFEQAVAAGNSDAAYQLGEMYAKDTYAKRDEAKAFACFQQAARAKTPVPSAFYNVGACYVNGLGTSKDITEGLAWLILAKMHNVDPRSEGRIRAQLKATDPDKIVRAEKRAAQLEQELFPAPNKAAVPAAKK